METLYIFDDITEKVGCFKYVYDNAIDRLNVVYLYLYVTM